MRSIAIVIGVQNYLPLFIAKSSIQKSNLTDTIRLFNPFCAPAGETFYFSYFSSLSFPSPFPFP